MHHPTVIPLFVVMVTWQMTSSIPVKEQKEVSKEQKACLLECLTCVEFWGTNYNGKACADTCIITDGASVDYDCTQGVSIAKRYRALKASHACKKQCVACALSHNGYSESACAAACEKSSGSDTDYKCSLHTLFKVL